MAVNKAKRLSKVASEFNVGISTIVEYLNKKGFELNSNPNTKVSPDCYALLTKEYSSDINAKRESEEISLRKLKDKKESVKITEEVEEKKSTEKVEVQEETVIIQNVSSPEKVDKPKQKEIKEPVVEVKKETPKKTEPAKEKPIKKAENKKVEPEKKEEIKKEIKKKEVVAEPVNKTTVEPTNEKKKETVKKDKPKTEKKIVKQTEKTETAEKITPKKEKKETPKETVKKESKPVEKKKTEKKAEKENKKETTKTPEKQTEDSDIKVIGKIDLNSINEKTRPEKKTKKQKQEHRKELKKASKEIQNQLHKKGEDKQQKQQEEDGTKVKTVSKDKGELFQTNVKKLTGPTVVGKIELPTVSEKKKPVASSNDKRNRNKKKRRKRIVKDPANSKTTDTNKANKTDQTNKKPGEGNRRPNQSNTRRPYNKNQKRPVRRIVKKEVTEEDVQKQIKETLARLTSKGKNKGAKYRKDKREEINKKQQQEDERQLREKNVLKVTEYVSVQELATMMDVSATEVISTCMNLGLFVSINQRLDAETLSIVSEEFGYEIEFTSLEIDGEEEEVKDKEEDLMPRAPIVTVMGHVDHGKTSLLDYIRNANVIAGEAGGITQHIGAYSVTLKNGKKMTFLDTPGHEAFTAMRARGAQVTDIAIIVVAADDSVMPQTIEAINHAQAAGVPIVFAINKIDKDGANPEKIKEELANMNYLVEEWGGKFQSKDISAKQGLHIEELLELVALEAEMLNLKANPDKNAIGSVIESSLDKGRGYIATVLVQSGTMKVGNVALAGQHMGRIKAIFNEHNQRITEVRPSEPALILGLNGAPQAGDRFKITNTEKEAKEQATKLERLMREQGIRSQKHITLDEIGRRIAIGDFKELNIIIKGDVDGSVEALSDSLIKLSTEQIQVNIIHKGVGQIAEADVMLATASNAIITGFQVRPSHEARRMAEKEQIDIRLYSIIYAAINEIKDAMEGMLSPEIKEEIVATLEIRETFKITKVGTIAGCMVKDGKIHRNTKIRIIRDGIVVYTGTLGSLKRFKDDVKEVAKGFECGLNVERYNDIKVGDIIEGYEEKEYQRKL